MKEQMTPPKPMLFGRGLRILAGACALAIAIVVGPSGFWGLLLLFVAASFIVGGLVANPGCEITALPNLVLSAAKRLHCF
jgi:hypothetical protein